MALHKSIPTKYGVPATYWKISSISKDFDRGVVSLVLHGYLNRKARCSGCLPLSVAKLEYTDKSLIDLNRQEYYALVAAEPEYAGSLLY